MTTHPALAMTGLVIVIGMLLFSPVLPSKDNADLHESEMPPAMSCDYIYDIQPAQTALSCNTLTSVILQCQVSSTRSNFSISWHHSTSEPEYSNIPATKYIHNSTSTVISMERNYFDNTSSLVSELTINEFSEKHNGYYWCSVNSSIGTNTTTPNPSIVLHILHQIDCAVESSECGREVHFYSSSSTPGRCADQDVSIDIVEAQNCTIEDLSGLATTIPTLSIADSTNTHTSDSPNADGSNIQNETSTETPINILMTKAPSLPLTLGIIIGASMGGLILVLFITIGLLLACMMRMKVHLRHQGRVEHKDDPTSSQSADDIHTYSSIPLSEKRDDSNRISKMALELNASYECLCPQAVTSQANNVYDYIQ